MARLNKLFSFTAWSRNHPKEPQPGDALDSEFAEQRSVINALDVELQDIRRSDGALVNGIVTKDSLAPDLFLDVKADVQNAVAADLAAAQSYAATATTAGNLAMQAAVDADTAATNAQAAAQILSTAQGSALADIALVQLKATADLAAAQAVAIDVKNADHDAIAAADLADKYAVLSSYWAEWMGADGRHDQTIPPNKLAEMNITGDHWSARWWATRAANAFGHLHDLYLGIHATAPTSNLSGGPLAVGSLYYDSTTNKPYIWNGTNWKPFFSSEKAHTSTLYYKAPAAATQTVFPLTTMDLFGNSFTYDPTDPEATEIHVNGVRLLPDDGSGLLGDYNVDNATSTVTFVKPLLANSIVTIDLLTPKNKLTPGSVNFHGVKDINLDPVTYAPGYQDGVRKVFTLQRTDSKPVAITDSEQLFVSVDGVVQQPGKDFTAAGSTLTFTEAPAVDAKVWCFWMEPGGSGTPGVLPPAPPDDLVRNIYEWHPLSTGGKGAEWVDGRGYMHSVANAAARIVLNDPVDIKLGSVVIEEDTGDIYAYAPGVTAGTFRWVKIYCLPTKNPTIWQGLHYDPATPDFIEWQDLRGTAETVQNTSDLVTIPASHLNYGKLVFAQDSSILYTSLVDTTSATGTMNDWWPIIPHAEMYLTTANLPDPATASPKLQDGQLAIVSLDAVMGKTINRPYFFDIATQKWLPLTQMQMSKALRTDPDRIAFAKDDLQVTYENGHQELKFWDGTAWQVIYSYDAIKNLVASSSLFEGTAQEVGGVAVGAVQLNALPNLSALAAAVDLTKVGHYWVWQGAAKYAVTAATPSIGADLAGAQLEPGDWLSISNTGTTAAPVFKWTVIRGDLISKSRGDTLFGLSPYVAGSWEYGSTVVYNGSIYRAAAGVVPTDPAPGAVGSPWARVPLDSGLVEVASDALLPATGTSVGQVYLIQNSAKAGGVPSLVMWDGTAWIPMNQSAITKYATEAGLVAATPAEGSLGFSLDQLRFFAYNGQRWTPFGFLTQDISEFNATRMYFSGDVVFYKDTWYRATNDTLLSDPVPGAVNAKWTMIGSPSVRNFAAGAPSVSSPAIKRTGDLYYDTTNSKLWAYDGTNWVAPSGGSGAKTVAVKELSWGGYVSLGYWAEPYGFSIDLTNYGGSVLVPVGNLAEIDAHFTVSVSTSNNIVCRSYLENSDYHTTPYNNDPGWMDHAVGNSSQLATTASRIFSKNVINGSTRFGFGIQVNLGGALAANLLVRGRVLVKDLGPYAALKQL